MSKLIDRYPHPDQSGCDQQQCEEQQRWDRELEAQVQEMNLPEVIPLPTKEALAAYLHWHVQPGSFLAAVLANDLVTAIRRADDANAQAIGALACWLCAHGPLQAWGSQEKVRNWINNLRN
jgi:hypothetical protein